MPAEMARLQAVVMGEKVYIGGGFTDSGVQDEYRVFQYDPSRNGWRRLPPHRVVGFAMAQFEGNPSQWVV